METNLKLNRK